MGISLPVLEFLLAARAHGIGFTETLTIGVQKASLSPRDAAPVFREHGFDVSRQDIEKLCWDSTALLRLLGAERVSSLDADPYEGAQEVADLNQPIPDRLAGRFSTVFDGGSIEHIFDVRQVVENYRSLLAAGGHLLCVTAANNLCGHGFYQFSPEFFYATFARERGWEARAVLLSTVGRRPRFFHAPDPKLLGRRVELRSRKPLYVYLVARKLETEDSEEHVPQQSDYVRAWSARSEAGRPRRPRGAPRTTFRELKRAARGVLDRLGWFRERLHGLGQPFYRPLSRRDLVSGRLRP